jgi:hypothetical protein
MVGHGPPLHLGAVSHTFFLASLFCFPAFAPGLSSQLYPEDHRHLKGQFFHPFCYPTSSFSTFTADGVPIPLPAICSSPTLFCSRWFTWKPFPCSWPLPRPQVWQELGQDLPAFILTNQEPGDATRQLTFDPGHIIFKIFDFRVT